MSFKSLLKKIIPGKRKKAKKTTSANKNTKPKTTTHYPSYKPSYRRRPDDFWSQFKRLIRKTVIYGAAAVILFVSAPL